MAPRHRAHTRAWRHTLGNDPRLVFRAPAPPLSGAREDLHTPRRRHLSPRIVTRVRHSPYALPTKGQRLSQPGYRLTGGGKAPLTGIRPDASEIIPHTGTRVV